MPQKTRLAFVFIGTLLTTMGCSSSSSPSTVADAGVGGAASGSGGGSAIGGGSATGGNSAAPMAYACGLPSPSSGAAVDKPAGSPGNLKVLNWAGYKGAVTYTFDDGNSSQIDNYSRLQALGVRYTFYLVTTWGGAKDAIWPQAIADGHEIGNHTKTHAQAGTADEVDGATQWLSDRLGVNAWTMAAPYGDASYASLAQTRFLINRGVSNALIKPNDNSKPFDLPCYIPQENATATADLNPQIDQAQSGGGWRVVLVHGFTGGSDSAYNPVSIDEFVANVEHAKSLGNLWIDSMVNVAAYWRGQKAFSTVTPATSGNDTTWTWTLPDHFPPGHCLRVTVDGGTLKQDGQPLPWDSHGYYEVALDKGALTLSP